MEFQDTFSSSVQDLAASAASKELKMEKVEHNMHQGNKLGASAVRELTRSLNFAIIEFKPCLLYFIVVRK